MALKTFGRFTMILLLCFVASGCVDSDDSDGDGNTNDPGVGLAGMRPVDDDDPAVVFPDGFLFGSSTAGFQVDMGCPTWSDAKCDDVHSDWYGFATSEQTQSRYFTFLEGQDPSDVGPGHWELFESDFDLIKNELSGNAFRMSIEWSRIFPEPTFGIEGHENLREVADSDNLAHYHDVFDALAERGITPLVTLIHYTLPDWIHDGVGCTMDLDSCTARGWLDPDTLIPEIEKYAGFVAAEFGDRVDLWATQNEPLAVLVPGFLLPSPQRTNPPASLFNLDGFKTAMAAMIDAHAKMYDAVKAADNGDADNDGENSMVGLVYAMAPVRPMNPEKDLDVQGAQNLFYLWNLLFLDAVCAGMFDAEMTGEQVFREDLANRMDFLGINYVVRLAVEGIPFSLLPPFSPLLTFNPLTMIMDEEYPRGIYDVIMTVTDRYHIPCIITENNGQSVPKNDLELEKRLVVEHLQWLARVIEDGADVRGYFYWSLIDNYEWNHGTTIPLGLYLVDPFDPSKARVPRPTVEVYSAIAGAGGIPSNLVQKYPIEP